MSSIERVAILSVHTCPLATLGGKKTGGMNVYVRDLTRELSRRGITVDVFTRHRASCQAHLDDSTLGENGRVIHIPAGPDTMVDTHMDDTHIAQFVDGVQAFAAQEDVRYDLIHSHYWLSGWVAEQLRETWGVPVLQMFHTLGHMKNRVTQNAGQSESPLRLKVETSVVKSVDCLVAATPAERIQLLWLYGADMRKIKVIPPGVDTRLFHPIPSAEARREIGIDEDLTMLLFVGRIEPLKGIDTLIRAAALLDGEHDNICVAVIGGSGDMETDENGEMTRLVQLREEMGIGDRITFLGARDQDRLQYYYSAAEVLIMPSFYESFGLVALEAMACGTPVIASEVGGLAYLVQDGVTGFHVPDGDAEQLAGSIRLLLDNVALHNEMSAAAVAHAQTYNWSHIADQIVAAYEEVLRQQVR